MTNAQILQKAIEKAHTNGYRPLMSVEQIIAHNNQFENPLAIIFTQDFAKAFWAGNEPRCIACGGNPASFDIRGMHKHPKFIEAWEYHNQQMQREGTTLQYVVTYL